jgi:hypothetical protein
LESVGALALSVAVATGADSLLFRLLLTPRFSEVPWTCTSAGNRFSGLLTAQLKSAEAV